jgi:NAD-dependent deacetylase
MKKILVFTGAGVSADSGVSTFRGNGLWDNYKISDVATPTGFKRNPQLVWDFYKTRHDQLDSVLPNAAHHSIVELEKYAVANSHEFILVTQNVDRLHLTAGSQNVVELHGNLHNVKCSNCEYIDTTGTHWISPTIPACPICTFNLRPDIVWFDEMLPLAAYNVLDQQIHYDIILVVGTSCQVYPAANMLTKCNNTTHIYECNIEPSVPSGISRIAHYNKIIGKAADVVPSTVELIKQQLSKE